MSRDQNRYYFDKGRRAGQACKPGESPAGSPYGYRFAHSFNQGYAIGKAERRALWAWFRLINRTHNHEKGNK